MNKVILKGRTTKAPEIKYSNGTDPMCYARFNLAVEDRSWKETEDKFHVDYISCFAMGNLAELIERSITKGQELLLCGKWRTSSYEKDGQKFYTQTLFIQELYYCGKKSDKPNSFEDFMIPPEMEEEMPFR